MNILLELRTEARVRPEPATRELLKKCADMIAEALADTVEEPTVDNLRRVNGLFARGNRILDSLPPLGDNGGGARMKQAA